MNEEYHFNNHAPTKMNKQFEEIRSGKPLTLSCWYQKRKLNSWKYFSTRSAGTRFVCIIKGNG